MNVNEYIASGILEEYVAGLLSDAENQAVESYAAQYPAIRAEIENIEMAIEKMALAQAQSPTKDVKSAILETIKAQPISKKEEFDGLVKAPLWRVGGLRWAAAIALLVSLGGNLLLWQQLNRAESQIVGLRIENAKMSEETLTLQANFKEKDNQVNLLAHQNTRRLALDGTPNFPKSKLRVYWQPESKTVFAAIDQLPDAPQGKQYQLWAIDKNGQPIDAGVLNDDEKNLQSMKSIADATAFAVTLEKMGGSPTPNLAAMYAIGKL